MGQTLTEKILSAHLVEGEMVKGSEIGIRIDQTLTQDATGTISAVSVKNTEFTSQDPVTVFVTKYILSVLVFRVKHLSVRTAIHRQAAV